MRQTREKLRLPAREIVIADTRNQDDHFVIEGFPRYGYEHRRWNLPFGDFALRDRMYNAVDIKSSSGGIVEIAKNVCSSDHERVRREIETCIAWGGRLCFLIANDDGVTRMEQLASWEAPRYKGDMYTDFYFINDEWVSARALAERCRVPMTQLSEAIPALDKLPRERRKLHGRGEPMTAIKGTTLMKTLQTMAQPDHYADGFKVDFAFCSRADAAYKILKILRYYARIDNKNNQKEQGEPKHENT